MELYSLFFYIAILVISFDHGIVKQLIEATIIIKCKQQLLIPFQLQIRIMDSTAIDKKISKAIALVSENETYQKKLFTFLCLLFTQIAFSSLINPMVFTNPLFVCEGEKATEAQYCANPDQCEYENQFTGTYYAGLYCENRDIRMSLQSIFAFGCIVGLLVMPAVSDTHGKWKSVNICLLCMLFGDLFIFFGIFSQMYYVIAIGQISTALGHISIVAISYSLNSDFFSDDLRQKALIYYCAAWGLTDMFVLIVYYIVPSWKFFTICLLIIPIIAFYAYFRIFFLESPNFLIHSRHDFKEAREVMKKLAQINNSSPESLAKCQQTLKQIEIMLKSEKKVERTAKESLKIVFSNPKFTKAIFCLIFIKMAYYSFYFGVQGCLERTGFNFGISVFLLGFGEFTGYMTGTKFVPKVKRKTLLLVTNILTACIGLLFMTKQVQQSPFLASIILYISFILNSYNFSAISLVETESFSSSIRSTALGVSIGTAYMIRIFIPFAIGYFNQRGIHPIIASSFMTIGLGVIPTLMVEETFGFTNLEQPLMEAQTQMGAIETDRNKPAH